MLGHWAMRVLSQSHSRLPAQLMWLGAVLRSQPEWVAMNQQQEGHWAEQA
jgi:hypothetical protein